MLEVVVERGDHFASGAPDARQQRIVLPVIAMHAEASDALIVSGERLDKLPGIVSSAVFDENDFEA